MDWREAGFHAEEAEEKREAASASMAGVTSGAATRSNVKVVDMIEGEK